MLAIRDLLKHLIIFEFLQTDRAVEVLPHIVVKSDRFKQSHIGLCDLLGIRLVVIFERLQSTSVHPETMSAEFIHGHCYEDYQED